MDDHSNYYYDKYINAYYRNLCWYAECMSEGCRHWLLHCLPDHSSSRAECVWRMLTQTLLMELAWQSALALRSLHIFTILLWLLVSCYTEWTKKKTGIESPEGGWKQGWGCEGVGRPPLLLPVLPGLWLLPSFGPTAGWSTLQCTHNTFLQFRVFDLGFAPEQ